jgi:hypothetical protein
MQSSLNMLHAAYPQGLPDGDYLPLLALLYEHFSDRNLAELVAAISDRDAHRVLNDIYCACSTHKPDASQVARVQQHLQSHGLSSLCLQP